LRLKGTKFDFGWGFAPDPTGGAYSVSPDPLAGFKGPASRGQEKREGKWRREEAPNISLKSAPLGTQVCSWHK